MDKKLKELLKDDMFLGWKELYELDPKIAAIDPNHEKYLQILKMEQIQPKPEEASTKGLDGLIQNAAYRKWKSIYETSPDAAQVLPNHAQFLEMYQRQGKKSGGIAYLMGM
jgi:3-mercaptopyruvate sulfurtransferase SseA